MEKILITGANSFIGQRFLKQLSGYEIESICLIENKVEQINFSSFSTVFHVAAIVHQNKTIPEADYFAVNSDLAFNVAQKAKKEGIKHFVFMSTVKVYGENSTIEEPWTETSDCHPVDAYGKSKLDAEKRLLGIEDESFSVSIIRTPVVYGSGVKGNVLSLAKLVKSKKIIPLKGIRNTRSMVYIGNLISLIDSVIKSRLSGIFLAGDKENMSTSELVEKMIVSTNQKKTFIKFPILFQFIIKIILPGLYRRLFGSMVIDNSKTKERLNFNPPFDTVTGIREVIDSI